MFSWIAKKFGVHTAPLAGAVLLLAANPTSAQGAPPVSPAQFDPSEAYYHAYDAGRTAEELEAKGDFAGALQKLKSARKFLDTITTYYPDWKPDMVTSRIGKNSTAQATISPKAAEQLKKNRSVVAELEGGVKSSGTLIDPAKDVMPLSTTSTSILQVDPLAARRLAQAETEVKRLRALATQNSNDSSREKSRGQDIARQRDEMQSQLRAAETNLQALRARLAAKPVEAEMNTLNSRIAGLEQEREAMTMALTQSREQHTEALSRSAILQADLTVMQQKRATLDRDLKTERDIANSVVVGQRKQLRDLEKELQSKNAELGKANQRISGLIHELQESRDAFAQIRTERDALLTERDHMSALFKLNDDGRIQDLIEQNMGLAKTLREANEKVERLDLDSNSAKDDIVAAKRDLAIAKAQINKLHQEKRQQDNRLAEVEKRLKGEEKALASGQVAADPAEVALLRDIIQRQLRVQERRRQARELLVEAVKDLGSQDDRIAQAVELFDGQEVRLSQDEQRMLADKDVDGEFVSPFAQDRATVGRNTSELNNDILIYERTAEKSYTAGRLHPTRELFEMILEQHPGHIPALCKLGIVHLKLKDFAAAIDTFRRAVELAPDNPYASRMLGFSLMSSGELGAAEEPITKAVELAPDDANAHMLLGTISYRLKRIPKAVSHFKGAISANPLLNEPYYNLALLSAKDGRLEEAAEYYHQALERGAVPNPSLEQRLIQP